MSRCRLHRQTSRCQLHRQTSRAVLAVGLSCLFAASASGNGRLPMAGQVVLSPRDADLLLLRTTFGIVVSHDHGASFQYVCEAAMHYGGAQDPPYALTPAGRVLLVTSLGYVRGSAGATHFDPTVPMRGGRDLTVDFAGGTWLLASTFQHQGDAGVYSFSSRLYRADVEGAGIDAGQWLPEDMLYETVETVPGEPRRVLLSGALHGSHQPDRAFLSLSEDGGEHFHRLPVPLVGRESSVYLAGIDGAGAAAQVYLRTAGGVLTPSRLLVGNLAELFERARRGQEAESALREVLRFASPMLGFALDHAGNVYAGGDEGIFRASSVDLRFEKRASIRARCLAARAGELWACADEASGFLLGLSRDGGHSFEAKLRLGQVRELVPGAEIQTACSAELSRMQNEYAAPASPVPEPMTLRRVVYVVLFVLLFVGLAVGLVRRRNRRSRAAR